jgi:hypothetical protein
MSVAEQEAAAGATNTEVKHEKSSDSESKFDIAKEAAASLQ